MTLQEFRRQTRDLPDDWEIAYESYDKGCCLTPYASFNDPRCYVDREHKMVVVNPGSDYDERGNE